MSHAKSHTMVLTWEDGRSMSFIILV
jgi:hypothetical protein